MKNYSLIGTLLITISIVVSEVFSKLTKLDLDLPHIVSKSKIHSINLAYYIDFSESKGNIDFTPSSGGQVEALCTPK